MTLLRLILLLCFLLTHFHHILCDSNTDREALLSFKSQVTDPKNALSGWSTHSNHCTWYGVICSKLGNRVQYLNLRGLSLSGKLSPHLSNLTFLHSLDLSNNTFHGQIPQSFGNLSLLTAIQLSSNNLSGTIPSQLGYLHRLQSLDFSVNNLTGQIPPSFANLSSLENLSLARNHLEGEIPTELGNLRNLSFLQISVNNFSGKFPSSIFNISSLVFLSVTGNNLTGELPKTFGHFLPNLKILYLASNMFEGVIPNSISNASHLQEIDLANNLFTGPIPLFYNLKNLTILILGNNFFSSTTSLNFQFFDCLRNSTKLQQLRIYGNQLTGELPKSFANLSSNLQHFCVADNSFFGSIPQGMKKFENIISLSFEYNFFTGELPSEIGALNNLQQLVIHHNRLSGDIPDIFGNLTNLFNLEMGNNQLSGRIYQSIGQCKRLNYLDMKMNRLGATVPDEIFQLPGLITLYLAGNSLQGPLSSMVGTMKQLETMDISDNQFSGNIPVEIGGCLSLKSLTMARNRFNGSIPKKIGNLTSLETLDLSLNSLTGAIPESLGQLEYMQKLNLSFNHLEGEVPMKGLFTNFTKFDLRGNNQLCSLNKEIVQNFGVLLCAVGKKKRKILLPIILAVVGAIALFISTLLVFWTMMSGDKKSRASKSFVAECEALKNVRHRNLVKVITSCSSLDYKGEEFKALVMQFMPNGNLDMKIHPEDEESGSFLTLMQRLNIAIDVASAMEYLHHGCDPPIVHCDLKPANVLLDENMVAHIADFGLARFLSQNTSEKQSTLGLKGSIGYIAPEYGQGGKASTEGDVYSFGTLLLEMFTAKKPTDEIFKEGLSVSKFLSAMDENEMLKVVDRRLIDGYEYWKQSSSSEDYNDELNGKTDWMHNAEECIADVIRLGFCCMADQPKERWSMRDALSKLQTIKHSLLPFQL